MQNKKRLRKRSLKILGKTEDGKLVVGGFFILNESQGIPLVEIVNFLTKKDYIISWADFIDDCIKCNWSFKTTLAKIEEALTDSVIDKNSKSFIISKCKQYLNSITSEL